MTSAVDGVNLPVRDLYIAQLAAHSFFSAALSRFRSSSYLLAIVLLMEDSSDP